MAQQKCCTPEGQIKRYKDCIGCDRKPDDRITMAEQTAVQSFWDKIALKLSVEQINYFLPELQKALEMEKEQNMKAYKKPKVITDSR